MAIKTRLTPPMQATLATFVGLSDEQRDALLMAMRAAKPSLTVGRLAASVAETSGVALGLAEAAISLVVALYTMSADDAATANSLIDEMFAAPQAPASPDGVPVNQPALDAHAAHVARLAQARATMREMLALDDVVGVTSKSFRVMSEHKDGLHLDLPCHDRHSPYFSTRSKQHAHGGSHRSHAAHLVLFRTAAASKNFLSQWIPRTCFDSADTLDQRHQEGCSGAGHGPEARSDMHAASDQLMRGVEGAAPQRDPIWPTTTGRSSDPAVCTTITREAGDKDPEGEPNMVRAPSTADPSRTVPSVEDSAGRHRLLMIARASYLIERLANLLARRETRREPDLLVDVDHAIAALHDDSVAEQARRTLSRLRGALASFRLDDVPPFRRSEHDDGSLTIELRFPDRRLAFTIEHDPAESGWHLVSSRSSDDVQACGGLAEQEDLRPLLSLALRRLAVL